MASIRIDKPEAARRQLDAAIRMLFSGEDFLAVHTVANAAYRIIRDLAEISGNAQFHEKLKRMIRPGREKHFWASVNKFSNFLKHADNDSTEILDIEEESNDVIICIACLTYESLGYQATPIMVCFQLWHSYLHPDLLSEDNPLKDVLSVQEPHGIRSQPRTEQLNFGKCMVDTNASI